MLDKIVTSNPDPEAAKSIAWVPAYADKMKSVSLGSALVGAGLLVVCVYFLWATVRSWGRRPSGESLEFKSEDGEFRVSIKALEQTLARAVRSLEEVHDMRVSIEPKLTEEMPYIHITATGSVFQDNDLHQAGERIRMTMLQHFRRMLRPDERVRCDVDVQRIVPSKGKGESKRPPVRLRGDEDMDFAISGPVYPVEVENEGTT
jgi:hypothetical protein